MAVTMTLMTAKGETPLQPEVKQVWIGIHRVHHRSSEVPGRHTMSMANDVDRPGLGPVPPEYLAEL